MTKYFLDTEFIEDGKTIDLISIGIVCEDGRELYLINYDCSFHRASQWVRDNVLIHLPPKPTLLERASNPESAWKPHDLIRYKILDFCSPVQYGIPEFWAYYADYDWVAFCQLFGAMMDLPRGFPMYCRDIKQECDRLGNPTLPKQEKGEHNALADAHWCKQAYDFLQTFEAY